MLRIRDQRILFKLAILMGSCTAPILAQQGLVATGGEAAGSGGSVAYSIGQVDYLSLQSTGFRLTQGLQQPYEISVTSGTGDKTLAAEILVFPNPTQDGVQLSLQDAEAASLEYRLISPDGKVLEQQPILLQQSSIRMTGLPAGAYLLQVFNSRRETKSFTIVKH